MARKKTTDLTRTPNGAAARSGSTPAPVGVLVPAVTAFDFLEGGFARAERSRLIGLVVAGLATVNLAASLAMGGVTAVDLRAQQDALTEAQTGLARTSAELAVLDQADGIPTAQIEGHIASREQALREAVGKELDTVRILRDLWSGAPAGITITNVRPGAAPSTDTKSAPATKDDAAPTGTPITITATADGFALLAQWSQALAATPGLAGVDMTWTGGGQAVQVTVTATLTDQALSARAAQVAAPAPAAPATAGQTGPGTTPGATSSSQVPTGEAADAGGVLTQNAGGD